MPKKNRSGAAYTFEQLSVWQTKLPEVKHAILPPHVSRPNPLTSNGKVYVSVFSPGAVCALDRKTGGLLWRRELPSLGSDTVHHAQGKLFAKTANTVYALEPSTGNAIWSFCPYGESGETIYSHPTVSKNDLFIGDRCGYLYCLDSRTGRVKWNVLTNPEQNSDVNSTPIVTKGLVVISTNAKMVAAYDQESGKKIWSCDIDGPSTIGPLLFRGWVAAITDSVYFLELKTGKIIRKFAWKEDGVSSADCTQSELICILRGSWPPTGSIRIVGLTERATKFMEASTAFVALIRYAKETGFIYLSHLGGIDIHRQRGGKLACKIHRSDGPSEVGQVDVAKDRIFALTGDGFVYALRHPSVPRS